MAHGSSKVSKVAGFLIFLVNFITMMLSLVSFAIGLWIIVSSKTLAYVIQVMGNSGIKAIFTQDFLTVQLGIGVSLLSLFFLFISLMGLYGSVYCSQFLLFMYAALILLVMLLECALFFYFASNILEKGVEEKDGQLAHVLRLALHCCDRNHTMTEHNPPWSCCGANYIKNCTQENYFEKNCKQSITEFLHRYETYIYGTIAATHILLSSLSLLRRASSASRSHT
ncbi:tetraspanin-9-like [Colias croceus]|uniref:tetraspanin-9-like n=1 Tax=Colias crocea TaxID=72248 RepID=UPI001E27B3E9|nr:tetraspanin-9-like [Colias croceus]